MTYFIVRKIENGIAYLESYNTIKQYTLEVEYYGDDFKVGSITPMCSIDEKTGKQKYVTSKDDLPIELFNFEYLMEN